MVRQDEDYVAHRSPVCRNKTTVREPPVAPRRREVRELEWSKSVRVGVGDGGLVGRSVRLAPGSSRAHTQQHYAEYCPFWYSISNGLGCMS